MITDDEIIQHVLELQDEGHTRKMIQNMLGFEKLIDLTRFMKQHGYNKDGEKYICETNVGQMCDTTNEEVFESQETYAGQLSHKENEEVFTAQEISVGQVSDTMIDLKNDALKKNLIGLSENFEGLMQMLSWYRANVGQMSDNNKVIEVINPGIQIDLPEAESFKTSIRVNKVVWDAFGSFAEQHKEFNKSDLLAQALKEFIEKH